MACTKRRGSRHLQDRVGNLLQPNRATHFRILCQEISLHEQLQRRSPWHASPTYPVSDLQGVLQDKERRQPSILQQQRCHPDGLQRPKENPGRNKNTNIQHIMRRVKVRLHQKLSTEHLWVHQDAYLCCQLLSLLGKTNCHCDNMAKRAINISCLNKALSTNKLPMETLCLYVDDVKYMTDVVKGLRH